MCSFISNAQAWIKKTPTIAFNLFNVIKESFLRNHSIKTRSIELLSTQKKKLAPNPAVKQSSNDTKPQIEPNSFKKTSIKVEPQAKKFNITCDTSVKDLEDSYEEATVDDIANFMDMYLKRGPKQSGAEKDSEKKAAVKVSKLTDSEILKNFKDGKKLNEKELERYWEIKDPDSSDIRINRLQLAKEFCTYKKSNW
ncbi:MAG: hypothetical protein AAF443_06520 [Chlamydiota bacterium]